MRPVLACFAAMLGFYAATPAAAQVLRDCDTWEASARNLMAPPEVAVRSFANGAVRVMGLDTVEPALAWAHLLITHPLPDEPFPGCVLISETGGLGFGGLRMEALSARYDPVRGLTLTVPVGATDGVSTTWRDLVVTVNQATGRVSLK
ncbi:hypothetical protein HKCCSP123_01315 [Rhodobacterales bacterium HKCCSP123]|nr:hypothetical protein [Rhodobacterales bacterium HKCCSP123]